MEQPCQPPNYSSEMSVVGRRRTLIHLAFKRQCWPVTQASGLRRWVNMSAQPEAPSLLERNRWRTSDKHTPD